MAAAPPATVAPETLLVGDTGAPAAGVDEATLRGAAAEHSARGLGVNARAMTGVRGGAARSLSRLAERVGYRAGTGASGAFDDEADGRSAERRVDEAFDALGSVEHEMNALLRASLGLDGDDARTVRDGDAISIDPDPAAICAAIEADDLAGGQERCLTLASRLDVRLDALSAESGWLDYRFDGNELLRIGYGPVNSVYELSLAGVAALALADETLGGGDGTVVPAMSGKMRLAFTATDGAAGREHGAVEYAIVEPIAVAGSDGARIAIAPSTVLAVDTNAANGQLRARVDLGALSMTMTPDDELGQGNLSLAGLTAELLFDAEAETVVATRVGIGRGPLRMTIDGTELLRLDLGDFGFRLDGDGRIALSGDLRGALAIADISGLGSRVALSLVAPSGTVASPAGDDVLRVEQGTIEAGLAIVDTDGTNAHEESLSLRAGECVSDDRHATSPDELRFLPAVVPCPR